MDSRDAETQKYAQQKKVSFENKEVQMTPKGSFRDSGIYTRTSSERNKDILSGALSLDRRSDMGVQVEILTDSPEKRNNSLGLRSDCYSDFGFGVPLTASQMNLDAPKVTA